MAAPVYATNDVPTATEFNVWLVNIIKATKTATESVTSSTTLQNDDQLVIALAANSTYWVQGVVLYDGATTGDFKVAFTGPAGASICLHMDGLGLAATDGSGDNQYAYESFGTAPSFGATGAGDHRTLAFRGTVIIASTAGNMQFQWAQDTSNATATRVLANSTIWAQRIS